MTTALSTSRDRACTPPTGMFQNWARMLVFRMLKRLRHGRLTVIDGQDSRNFGPGGDPQATIRIRRPEAYRHILWGGSVGAGESYLDGSWETDDLTALVRLMLVNLAVLENLDGHFSRLTKPLHRLLHRLKDNTRRGSKQNILAHYDLSNRMYASFLDSQMMYSSAIYPNPDSSLEEAAVHKLDLICRKLELKPEDRVIEIGTGWGGFALYAASRYGCRVTTTTISNAQYQEAARRIEAAGLENRITLLKQDYRDLTGEYDKLVSIEMIEAVGNRHLPGFFRKCCSLLKRDGLMLLQAITIADQKFDHYLHNVDFIQRYIFPGGFLPSNSRMLELLKDQTDMVARNIEDFGFHYARTLKDWRNRFLDAFPSLEQEGFDERFKRLWEFYLCYCEGGFLERSISVVQLTATRPWNRSAGIGVSFL